MDLNVAVRSKKKPGMTEVLYATRESLATIAEPVANPSTQEAKVSIAANHTFAEGDGFRRMFVNLDKSNLNLEGAGDRYSKTNKIMLKCFIPGDSKFVAAMVKDDPDFLVLVRQNPCQSGSFWQIGTKCDLATIEAGSLKWTSGTIDGSTVMGWEFDLMCYQDTIYYYEGQVTLAEPA
jgi:hypothetical protein